MKKWLVSYDIPDWPNRLIVIWADDRSEVKKVLKRHMGSRPYSVNSIKEVAK